MSYTKPFKELNKSNADIAGGKGASLGEMINSGIPVPDGYVVLADTFEKFIRDTDLIQEIDAILNDVDHKAVHTVDEASEKIQGLIKQAEMPKSIADEIISSFDTLNAEFVAVRSSATAEDGADHAWAGQLDSYLNITKDNVLEKVQHCWASLFTPRAIFYRFEKGLNTTKISVAVVVQKMVNSEKSGIAFSVHPVTEDRNQLIIEAGLGLGEAIVSGSITPDAYVVEKEPRNILDVNIAEQSRGLFRKSDGGNEWIELGEKGKEQILSEEQINGLSELIIKIENHYGFPCDIEWAFENEKFFIVQSRPITTLAAIFEKKEDISLIEKYDWDYSHERVMSYRMMEMFYVGSQEIASKVGCNFNSTLYRVEKNNVKFFYDKGELKRVFSKWGEVLSDQTKTKFIDDVTKELKIKYKNFSKEIDEFPEDFKKLSSLELKDVFNYYIKIDNEMSYPQWILFFQFEKELTDNLKRFLINENVKDVDNFIEILSQPITMIPADQYTLDILKTLDDNSIGYDIDSLSKKYKHWGCFDVNYPEKDRAFHIEQIEKIKNDSDVSKDKIEEKYKNIKNIKNDIVSKYKFNNHTNSLIELFKTYADLKEWKNFYREEWTSNLKKLYEEISYRSNLKLKDILFYTNEEIIDLIKSDIKIDYEEIIRRMNNSVFLFLNDNLYIYKENLEQIDKIINKTKEDDFLKGQTAFKGKVRGFAKIINSSDDFEKIKEGDILVTPTTRPSYLPIMQKCSAIVTNEGGLLSHAAIVSRELKKPCVIGTKNATGVLKDGDKIEVDADNGIVKKIN